MPRAAPAALLPFRRGAAPRPAGHAAPTGLQPRVMPGWCEDYGRSTRRWPWVPPGCTEGVVGAAWGAAARWQPWGHGCGAHRGRGGGSTPLPPLFFSQGGRHTPLPAQAATALPAPAAIIRRAAGGRGCGALPWGSRHPRGGLAGPTGLCRSPVLPPRCQPRGAEAVSG